MQIRSSFSALPITVIIAVLALADFFYQHNLRGQTLLGSIPVAMLDGALYTLILWMVTRLDLARVTICYLALPYLFFIPGWLNTPTALLLSIIFVVSLWRTLGQVNSVRQHSISWHDLTAFVLILCWVNLSGAGGYGYQMGDWMMHNARLHDLTQLAWPIRYDENQNLVYYIGYFLPSAIIGKITSLDIGIRSLFPWTVLGVALAIRWLSVLSRWRFTLLLVLLFALFGPLDIFSVLFMNLLTHPPLQVDLARIVVNTDFLDFRMWHSLGFFIGNYLSNTPQLYWSPQQVISGWLGMGLLTYLFFNGQLRSLLFVYALLCLWAPFAMIALFPFMLFAIVRQLGMNWRLALTFENVVGAFSLAALFATFYTSGSTSANLAFWVFSELMGPGYLVLFMFYLFAWGLYVIAISAAIRNEGPVEKSWFLCLLFSLLLLPIYVFGDFADLLCRGSAPLMFLLLVFLLKALHHYWQHRRWIRVLLLCCLLITGWVSAGLHNRIAIQKYGRTQPVLGITHYHNAFPNLGPDHSPFEHWFRKKLP